MRAAFCLSKPKVIYKLIKVSQKLTKHPYEAIKALIRYSKPIILRMVKGAKQATYYQMNSKKFVWKHLLVVFVLVFSAMACANKENPPDSSEGDVAAILALESDADYGEYLASECLTCHSPDGANGSIPQIHGNEKAALATALLEYKKGERENEVMKGIATNLSNEDIAALVTYLSQQ